jgi:hypothetical protein
LRTCARHAYRELGDLLDALSVLPAEYADWPTRDQLDALREARESIRDARQALNRAAG